MYELSATFFGEWSSNRQLPPRRELLATLKDRKQVGDRFPIGDLKHLDPRHLRTKTIPFDKNSKYRI